MTVLELGDVKDYWGLIGLAAGAGAAGGLISALLPGARSSDWWKSAIIGGGAAVAIMLVLPPTTDSVEVVDGESITTTTYNLIQLLATSLIAGSAGPRIFKALQDRTVAALAEQGREAATEVAKARTDESVGQLPLMVQNAVTAAVTTEARPVVGDAVQSMGTGASISVEALAQRVAKRATESVQGELDRQLEATHKVIDAAARPSSADVAKA